MAGAVAAGLGLRVWVLASPLGAADSDESWIGLTGRALLHGHATAFYGGQRYGGTQEAALVAGVRLLTQSWLFSLKCVPVTLSAIAAVLVWRIGRRMVGEPAARTAALLFWVGPVASLWLSTKARGFYGPSAVLGLAVVLLALRLAERPALVDAALAGLAAGLGWWASPNIVYFVVPAVVWLVWRRPGVIRLAGLAGAGWLLGAAPWLVNNLGSHWASLNGAPYSIHDTYSHRLHLFLEPGLPIALGLRQPWTERWLLPFGHGLYLVAGLAAAVVVVRRRRPALLLLICAAYPFEFAASPFSWFVADGRYIWFLLPAVALFVAPSLGPGWLRVAGIAALIALSIGGLVSVLRQPFSPDANLDVAPGSLAPLLADLSRNGVTAGFADYWIAYRVDLATDARLELTPLNGNTRDPALAARARSSRLPAYIAFAGSGLDRSLGSALTRKGVGFTRSLAGRFALYLPDARVLPESLPSS